MLSVGGILADAAVFGKVNQPRPVCGEFVGAEPAQVCDIRPAVGSPDGS